MQAQKASILLVAKVFLFSVIGMVGCHQYGKIDNISQNKLAPVSSSVPSTPTKDDVIPSTDDKNLAISSSLDVSDAPSTSVQTSRYTLRSTVTMPLKCNGVVLEDTLVLFSFGQSISANANEKLYPKHEHVYTLNHGECVQAQDPLPLADGMGGSMWMPVATKIIESGLARNVLLVSIGVGGSSIERWSPDGDLSQHLEANLELLNQLKIPVSMFLWHQGSSNIGTSADAYVKNFLAINKTIRAKGFSSPILVAIHSRCFGSYDVNIENAQRLLAQRNQDGLFLGADTNMLGDGYRYDHCHLNSSGQEFAANLWVDAIKSAEQLASLLRFGW